MDAQSTPGSVAVVRKHLGAAQACIPEGDRMIEAGGVTHQPFTAANGLLMFDFMSARQRRDRSARQPVFAVKGFSWPKPVGEDFDTVRSQVPLGTSDQAFDW